MTDSPKQRNLIKFIWLLVVLALLTACTRPIGKTVIPVVTSTPTKVPGPLKAFTATPSGQLPLDGLPTPTIALPTLTSTAQPGPLRTSTPTPFPRALAVFNLAEGDLLNVRESPGTASVVLDTLSYDSRDLKPTGSNQQADGITWLQIEEPAGWVSMDFVIEQVGVEGFCADARIGELLDKFALAVRSQDGQAFGQVVSPAHGLRVHAHLGADAVMINDSQALSNLFTSTVDYDWGLHPASGLPEAGPFKEKVLPGLQDVLGVMHKRYCNSLAAGVAIGATNAQVAWPADYAAMNYVALYRPAPAEQEQDWRTWAAGIDYVDGTPYLAVLIQLTWLP